MLANSGAREWDHWALSQLEWPVAEGSRSQSGEELCKFQLWHLREVRTVMISVTRGDRLE